MEELKLILLWSGWCFVHSLLITPSVTKGLQAKLGSQFYWFRLTYNIIAVVSLILIWQYQPIVDNRVIFSWQGFWRYIQLPIFIIAIGLFIAGAKNYDMLQFLGIRQLREKRSSSVISSSGLFVATGVLRYTRHPWYLGGILMIWTGFSDLTISKLIMNVVWTLYFVVGAYLEERKLVTEFGDAYRSYQAKVSMLIPFKSLLKKAAD